VWVRKGLDACMNQFNADPQPEQPKKERPPKTKKDDPPAATEAKENGATK